MYPEQVSLPFGIGSEKEVRPLGPSAWKREMWPRIRHPYKFLEPEAFHLADRLLFAFPCPSRIAQSSFKRSA